MLEKRIYPLLAVVLTASIVCLSTWRLSGCPGPPYCYYEAASYLLLVPENVSTSPAPYPVHILPAEDERSLIDLGNFTFRMNAPVCNGTSPLFIVVVHSAPQNSLTRQIIRETWGRDIHVVFFVGETTEDVQNSLDEEGARHHDIVQGSFLDTYRNLTYKHVMVLKWVTYFCPGARYILKTDDDVFVNTLLLKDFLNYELSSLGARKLIMCDIFYNALVKRSYRSKWRVSHTEYKNRWYPDYCSGWAILYSPDVVFQLYREAQRSTYFWIDDVHLTGTILAKLNYSHTNVGSLRILESETLSMMDKGVLSEFLFSLLPPIHFHKLWDMVREYRPVRTKTWSNFS